MPSVANQPVDDLGNPAAEPAVTSRPRRDSTGRLIVGMVCGTVAFLLVWLAFEARTVFDRLETMRLFKGTNGFLWVFEPPDAPRDLPLVSLIAHWLDDAEIPRVRAIEIYGGPLDRALLPRIARLGTLTRLMLNDAVADPADVGCLGSLASLERLYLSGDQITDEALPGLEHLKNLDKLILYDTKITDAGMRALARIQVRGTLAIGFAELTDEGLMELSKMTGLKKLYLGQTNSTPAGWARLRQALPTLKIVPFDFGKTGTVATLWSPDEAEPVFPSTAP